VLNNKLSCVLELLKNAWKLEIGGINRGVRGVLPQGSRRWVWMIAENNSNLICIKVNYV